MDSIESNNQTPPKQIAVKIENLQKSFQKETPVLRDFNLSVHEKEFLCVLGPSGCGKSTLLRLIAELEQPDSGVIDFSSRSKNPEIAYVFQQPNLLPWRTVESNIGLPLELKGVSKDTIRKEVSRSLQQVGLAQNTATKLPSELSGGMQMRASLARAIVTKPKILLLDEPFGALDEVLRHRLNEELFVWAKQNQWTVLFVTHSVTEAVFMGTRTILLTQNGRIVFEKESPLGDDRTDDLRTSSKFNHLTAELSAQLRQLTPEDKGE